MLETLRNMIEVSGSQAHTMRRALRLSFVSSVVQGLAFALLFPLFAALFTGDDAVWWYFGAFAVLVIIEALIRLAENFAGWRIYVEVTDETRIMLGDQLKRMPLEKLSSRQTGDLNMVLTSNVQDVVSISSSLYAMVIQTIVAPVVTIVATAFVDWRLALALLVIFPVAVPLYQTIRKVAAKENRISAAAHADTTSHIVEYLQGLAVLRATRQVGSQSRRLADSISRLRAAQHKGTDLGTVPSIAISTLVQLGIVAVIALALLFTLQGSLGVAALFALIVICIRFSEPLALFANMASMFDFMESAIERIRELLAVTPLPIHDGGGQVSSSRVDFEAVTFSYAGSGEVVLRDLSFSVAPASLTALVGSSGSGKTTVTKLLSRYADPQSGTVRIGGVDISTLTSSELMKQISVVFQDVYLFDDSILENIRLARPSATDDEVTHAAKAANCHDFALRLPQGYNTRVGEIGSALSGGERQRISIARAILKDAPIVILDEPTSALDTESEVAVQRAIDSLVANKTVIVIAHRLSTVVAADQILVLEGGRLVNRGNHADLLAANGRYQELWAAQQSARAWRLHG